MVVHVPGLGATPQLPGLPSLPKDRGSHAAGGAGASLKERLQRQRVAGRLRETDRQVVLPDVQQEDDQPPSLERIASTDLSERSNSGLSEALSGEETERVTAICTCEELDKARISEMLRSRLSLPLSWSGWSAKQESLHVPLLQNSIAQSGNRPRSLSLPTLSPRLSTLLQPGQLALVSRQASEALCEPMLTNYKVGASLESGRATAAEENATVDSDCDKCLVFFEYGVVVMWGLTNTEEEDVLAQIVKGAALRPLPKTFVETDEVSVRYCVGREPAIRNDVVTLPRRQRRHVGTRLAIAHALAQSTKLSVFEAQGLHLVQSTRHLPRELAERGHVSLSRSELAKLMGRLFIQKSEVDQLSSVLDTPDYFWEASDSVQELYKRVCEYLEMSERIEAVNGRLEVSQSMLDMLQNQLDVTHGVRLEWIVIVLVALEGLIGLMEFAGTIGLIPKMHYRGQWAGNGGDD